MQEVTNKYGKKFDLEAAANMMDDDLREEIHHALAPCSPQLFFDTYCREHEKRFGEPWILDEENPQW